MQKVLVLGVLLLVAGVGQAATPAPFPWPDGRKAAVSLAYDDALDSQLDHAIPALDRHGFKGSFYLHLARPTVRDRLAEWRAAAVEGHELGNHSLFHQCSASLPGHEWVKPEDDLDTTTAARMQAQVRAGNAMLQAIDGKSERTYTVPCGDEVAQDGNYVDGLEGDFIAIKVMGGAVTPDMWALDPHAVTVEAPVDASGAELIAQVEEAGRRGTMVNFTFHGIGGDYLTVSTQAHEELLAWLDAHRDEYWVDTFANLMRYVRTQQAAARRAP